MRLVSLFVLIVLSAISVRAQITFLSSDMPAIGDTIRTTTDTVPIPSSVLFPTFGANQSWNFADLVGDFTTTSWLVTPASTAYSGDFPSSTHAATQDGNAFAFFDINGTRSLADGLAGPLAGLTTVAIVAEFNPSFTQYNFPTQYNGTFAGTYSFEEEINGSDVTLPPSVPITPDKIRVRFSSDYEDTIVGWGTVTTPLGTYEALLEKRVDITNTDVDIKIFSISPWSDAFDLLDTATVYNWVSKETKGPVVTMTFDSVGNIATVVYSLTPPTPDASFTWNNPSGGLVDFTNTSTNSPDTYAWDFGDGNFSSMENPSHVYGANGTYTVCLIASNSTGSDTTCQAVTVNGIVPGVNNPPVANTDEITMDQDADTTFSPLDNDQDPDGDNISLTSTGTASNGTVSSSGGDVTYTPTPGWSGTDTINYVICDDGTPAIECDTGMIIITVVAPPLPMTLSFTYTTDSCNGLSVTNTSQNIPQGNNLSWTVESTQNPAVNSNTFTVTFDTAGSYEVCALAFDAGGQLVEFCDTITVTCDTLVDGIGFNDPGLIGVYPNPTNSSVMVSLGKISRDSNLDLRLYNTIGQQVWTSVVTTDMQQVELDMRNYEEGVYMLILTDASGTAIGSSKIIKTQ